MWLGTSVESQKYADERIPALLRCPAAMRFLSCEPQLESVKLQAKWLVPGPAPTVGWVIQGGESGHGARRFDVQWARSLQVQCKAAGVPYFLKQLGANVIDRNDAGFDGDGGFDDGGWPAEHAQDDRVEHDIDGARDDWQGAPVRIHLKSSKGGSMEEWPENLRCREFPAVRP